MLRGEALEKVDLFIKRDQFCLSVAECPEVKAFLKFFGKRALQQFFHLAHSDGAIGIDQFECGHGSTNFASSELT